MQKTSASGSASIQNMEVDEGWQVKSKNLKQGPYPKNLENRVNTLSPPLRVKSFKAGVTHSPKRGAPYLVMSNKFNTLANPLFFE